MSDKRRVVVTGLGAVSAYGIGANVIWDGMEAGKTAIKPLSQIDTSGLKTSVGATVDREALQHELQAIRLRYTDITVSS
ncbi:MAG: beta-ACP synthase, partial [Verrucomicrobia bacterium]|nr:beta-ACP synthase [Verrucomicrobiota bacterium]